MTLMVRAGRRFSSLAFSMRKAYQKILNLKPSWLIIALAAVVASIFLLGGGVFDIIVRPVAIIPGLQGRWIFFYPRQLNSQILNESIIVMLLYGIGFGGFWAMYQSTKYAYKPRQAFILLLAGAVLVILAYFSCETIINLKLGR